MILKNGGGGEFLDKVIEPPNRIKDMPNESEIVITAIKYYSEIVNNIKSLNSRVNCVSIDDWYELARIQRIQDMYENDDFVHCFQKKENETRIRSKEEYLQLIKTNQEFQKFEDDLTYVYKTNKSEVGKYIGFCAVCGKSVAFHVKLNQGWCETVTCPVCKLRSRTRIIAEYAKKLPKDRKVYLYEAVTPMTKQLSLHFHGITCSEYWGDKYKSGEVVNGVMHQDAMHLSFDDEIFDVMISCEVFEHVADYKQALREAYRCLRDEGKLIITIPFYRDRKESVIRTKLKDDGSLEYLLPPVYHGNPIDRKGSLVFFEIGWQIIDELKEVGFKDAYAVCYASVKKGHFGGFPCYIVGEK